MCREPPRSTRTCTVCPHATLFRSAAGEPGVRCLRYDDYARAGAGIEYLPLFEQGAGAHHRERLAAAEAEPSAIAAGGVGAGQDVASADDRSEEHPSEHRSLMRHSYAVFFLTQKKRNP